MAQFSEESAAMEKQKRYHGSLIAFEGPENLVSTQLRLLPSSPQLLILPGLQQYMKEDSNTRFDPRSYVKSVHHAAQTRHEIALQFLNNSTSDNKRLVFLNGGTAAAVSQCISTIGERQVSGDLILAEAIYKNITSEGARGLEQDAKNENQQALEKLNSERDLDELLWEHVEEDPITRAMRAADALYQETEFLQPIDCYIRTRPRSVSLPMLEWANEMGQASPFFVFGSSPSEGVPSVFDDEGEEEPLATEEDLTRSRSLKSSQGGHKVRFSAPRRPASSTAEAIHSRNVDNRSTLQLFPSAAHGVDSPPATPEGVVYGEARLVQMHAAKSRDLRKVRSLDDMGLFEARRRQISAQFLSAIASPLESPEAKSRHLSIAEDPYSPNNLLQIPAAKFVKAQKTIIRRSPTFPKNLPKPARDSYVHQGTDVADFGNETAISEGDFEPVLPLLEDLVVHFTSFSPDYVLSSVVQSLKNGLYPLLSNTSGSFGTAETAETDSCPSTPRTADLFDLEVGKSDGLYTVPEEPSADEASDYDPFAPQGSDVRCAAKTAFQQPNSPSPTMPQPPTPSQANVARVGTKFHDFSTPGHPNAIVTQNALRLVLEGYYPQQEGGGYLQFNATVLSDMNSLWRPMFEDFDLQGNKPAQHTADLILAIGSQQGVKSEFVSMVTGQIEKLGSKPNGMSRSGRLDIRYLIATAMQSYSTHPLTSLAESPLADSPYSLACFLVPHLETYLATNTATRFLLLSYPAEHLSTVLALQKLMGADKFNIAGILDASNPSTFADVPSPSSPLSTTSTTTTTSSQNLTTIETSIETTITVTSPQLSKMSHTRSTLARRRRVSFSRADYLLTSSATETEINSLVSTIWAVLIEIDSFYAPEPPAQPRGRSTRGQLTLVSKYATPASPPMSPPYKNEGAATTPRSVVTMDFPYPPPLPPTPAARSDSPSRSSIKSAWSIRSSRGRQQQQQNHIASATGGVARRGGDDVATNGSDAVSMVDEGDFDDAEERRLMPMYMRQSELRKGNSRKALKWLGLA
ncbi:hypothetical protein N0V82_002479 [Gnomoniopsis sp. IMI 355080]|nr:hypothetical protein N0V82_002479 [Gnomoniopsis sp. IMI 355080]